MVTLFVLSIDVFGLDICVLVIFGIGVFLIPEILGFMFVLEMGVLMVVGCFSCAGDWGEV